MRLVRHLGPVTVMLPRSFPRHHTETDQGSGAWPVAAGPRLVFSASVWPPSCTSGWEWIVHQGQNVSPAGSWDSVRSVSSPSLFPALRDAGAGGLLASWARARLERLRPSPLGLLAFPFSVSSLQYTLQSELENHFNVMLSVKITFRRRNRSFTLLK